MSWWPGSCKMTFDHSPDPLHLPTKDGRKRVFSEICKESVPECNLHPLLFNGHLQTAYTSIKSPGAKIHYKRRVFEQEDPAFAGHFTVDFVVAPPPRAGTSAVDGGPEDVGLREDPVGVGHYRLPPRTTYFTNEEFKALPSDDDKPLLITLHGLSGGSYENYLRTVIEPLVRRTSEAKGGEEGISGGPWEALVINSRGCAGSKITTSILYNARATWDTRQVVKWCRKIWPNRPLFAVGYSLGANILTNYLGEEGEDCIIKAACVVSNPWNLEIGSILLQRTWIGLEVYSKTMGEHMRTLFETHKEQITKNEAISVEKVEKLRYLHDFDRLVQCATWGYTTEYAYYRDASSSDAVSSIRIPTFAIGAVDDPIAADQAVPRREIEANPYVVLCSTSGGGHLAWFQWGGTRWQVKPIVNYFNAMAKEISGQQNEAKAEVIGHGGPHGGLPSPFVFTPMRRKCHVREVAK